jgi:hypothetical protein
MVEMDGGPVRAEEDGFFSHGLGTPPRMPRKLTVADERGLGSRTIELGPGGPFGLDVGDVAIAPRKGATLLVLDDQGKPIRGAVAQSLVLGARVSAPSDESGRIGLASSGEPYRIAAWGRAVAQIDVPEAPQASVEVRLAPATILRIRLLGEAPGAAVLLRSDAKLLPPDAGKDSELLAAVGTTVPGGLLSEPGTDLSFEPHGAIALCGLAPDLPFRVQLVDALGLPHETHEITLKPAEERAVTVTPQRPYRTVQGVVRDDKGEPVAGARVEVAAPGAGWMRRSLSGSTDENGRFAFPGVTASEVQLCVDAVGLVPWAGTQTLPPRGDGLEVRLASGRPVRVLVVDATGAPLMADVSADLGPYLGWPSFMHTRFGWERPGGAYEIEGLPDADVDVTASRPGAFRTVHVGAHETEVRVVLPGK